MHRIVHLIVLLSALGLFSGCGDTRSGPGPTPSEQRDRDAERVVNDLEGRVATVGAMAPEERAITEARMGPELERAAADVAGTPSENKVLYWLAAWRLEYAGGEGVDNALDRLDGSRYGKLKAFGERLRIEHRLRQGNLADAKLRAAALVERIPEFQPVLNLVWLYEQVGRPPPRTAGQSLAGGADDPATARAEPWLLYLFVDVLNADGLYTLRQYLNEAGMPRYAGKLRLVCVTSEGTPLNALSKIRTLPRGNELDVLWASPAEGGDAAEWRKAWNLAPHQNATVLLGPGPKRVIMAILHRPDQLRLITGN